MKHTVSHWNYASVLGWLCPLTPLKSMAPLTSSFIDPDHESLMLSCTGKQWAGWKGAFPFMEGDLPFTEGLFFDLDPVGFPWIEVSGVLANPHSRSSTDCKWNITRPSSTIVNLLMNSELNSVASAVSYSRRKCPCTLRDFPTISTGRVVYHISCRLGLRFSLLLHL